METFKNLVMSIMMFIEIMFKPFLPVAAPKIAENI